MYTDFHDQNGNPVAASVVLEAIKNPIIKHSVSVGVVSTVSFVPTIFFTEEDIIRNSLIFTNSCASDGIKLGSVNIGVLKVTLKNETFGLISDPNFLIDKIMEPTFDLNIDENTKVTVMGGDYWIKEVEQLAEGVRLTCYDSMCKLDEPFTLGTITGTPYQIFTQAATACGLTVSTTQAEMEALPNGTRTFTLHSDNDCKTWRDVLSYLSMLMGCFVTMERHAYRVLALSGIGVHTFGNGKESFCDTVTDVHRYKGAKFSIFDTEYKAIELTAYAVDGEDTIKKDFTYAETTGVTGQTIKLGYNPFIQADTPEADLTQTQRDILHELLTQVDKYAYTPMQISLPVGFIYDLGDVIKCTGGLANTGFAGGYTEDCYCCISNYTYTYGKEFRIKTLESKAAKARPIVIPTPPVVPQIFGVYSDYSAAAMTRTDDAVDFTDPEAYFNGATTYGSPFDNLMPWSGIERVSNAEAGELVKIPKFWYKLTIDHTVPDFKLQIANYAAEGFKAAPAFQDRGDGKGERDVVYVGRYPCSSSWKSETGVDTSTSMRYMNAARIGIHALGADVWQWDYAMLVTIQMLYIVEYANWQAILKIGQGNRNAVNSGGTDNMPYHSGNTGASHGAYGNNQYRYIENLWDSQETLCEGIRFDRFNRYGIKNPADFSITSGGSLIGTRYIGGTQSGNKYYGWITQFGKGGNDDFDWAWEASAVRTNRPQIEPKTYILDQYTYDREGVALSVCYTSLFQYRSEILVSSADTTGEKFRLMVLP